MNYNVFRFLNQILFFPHYRVIQRYIDADSFVDLNCKNNDDDDDVDGVDDDDDDNDDDDDDDDEEEEKEEEEEKKKKEEEEEEEEEDIDICATTLIRIIID